MKPTLYTGHSACQSACHSVGHSAARSTCRPSHSTPPDAQRGVGTLTVTLLLMFAASIAVFHLNRGLIFEQRSSVNQGRSTAAFELAEAGIEWASGMLNSPLHIGADCQPLPATGVSFRRRFLQAGDPTQTAMSIATDRLASCRFDGGALVCACPAEGGPSPAAPVPASLSHLPGFAVSFSPVTDPATGAADPTAVRVTSVGCPAQAATPTTLCRPAASSGPMDEANEAPSAAEGSATVSVILKLLPSLRVRPAAALTCGGDCDLAEGAAVTNTDAAVSGLLVHAGGQVRVQAGARLQSLPGQPTTSALVSVDPPLATLSAADAACTRSAVVGAFFGRDPAQRARVGGEVMSLPGCTDAGLCGAKVGAAFEAGWRSFHFPDGFSLDGRAPGAHLGSPQDGVRLVSDGPVRIEGSLTLHGLLVSNSPGAEDLDTGRAEIRGAVIACGAHRLRAGSRIVYSASALEAPGLAHGTMVRVPGSWRDF